MPKIIWKGIIAAGVAILLTSCKASEPAESAGDDLYPYLENQQVGFLNSNLKKEIDPQFKFVDDTVWPYSFSEGLAAVNFLGKTGYIDRQGNIAIEPKFDYAQNFKNGKALVRNRGQYGFINQDGDFIIEPQYHNAKSFSDGLAPVQQNKRSNWGYINQKGVFDIQPHFEMAHAFSEDRALVQTSEH